MPWTASTVTGTEPQVVSGSLSYPDYTGALAPTGNSLNIISNPAANSTLKPERVDLQSAGLPNASTLFYSMLVQVTDITSLASTGVFVAGFNNSPGSNTANVTQAGARLSFIRDTNTSTTFHFGIRNDITSSGTSPNNFETTQRNVGETYLVVAEYEYNTGSSTDDVAHLWVDPASASLGGASAPSGDITSTGGDISQLQLQSFFFRPIATGPRSTTFDELRVGTTWASVTSVPEPASIGLLGLGTFAAIGSRRKRC